MTEETEKLLKELVRLVVEERQLLINHIRLTEPRSTDNDLFLAGLRTALESLGKRVSSITEAIDKLNQNNAQSAAQLKTVEDLVRPLHAFAYSVVQRCPNCTSPTREHNNDTRPCV